MNSNLFNLGNEMEVNACLFYLPTISYIFTYFSFEMENAINIFSSFRSRAVYHQVISFKYLLFLFAFRSLQKTKCRHLISCCCCYSRCEYREYGAILTLTDNANYYITLFFKYILLKSKTNKKRWVL